MRKGTARNSGLGAVFVGADMTPEELEFCKAMDRYKRNRKRPYPTFSEVLKVIRSLGYRKVADGASTTDSWSGVEA